MIFELLVLVNMLDVSTLLFEYLIYKLHQNTFLIW